MIGWYCSYCAKEHRDNCPYGIDKIKETSVESRRHTTISIPIHMNMNETIEVYVEGKYITLKRIK